MANTNSIIDLSHMNQNPDFQAARTNGISSVIHKATQGTSFVDPTYSSRFESAEAAGLLWGAYHFGTGGDGVEQADFFLQTIGSSQFANLLVLDFEANPQGSSMPLEEAHAFVTRVQSVTGRWPGLYGGAYLKQLLGSGTDSVLAACWLWIAQYGPTAVVPPNWKSWTLWQYTNGAQGNRPYSVNGIGTCNRDTFNGSDAELRQFWNPAQEKRES